MRLPHRLVYAPRVARMWWHDGWTLGFWTFVHDRRVSPRFVRHEYRHTIQWAVGTALGAVVIGVLHLLFGVSLWWWLAAPAGFLLPYLVLLAVYGYQRHPLERDAERYADRSRR